MIPKITTEKEAIAYLLRISEPGNKLYFLISDLISRYSHLEVVEMITKKYGEFKNIQENSKTITQENINSDMNLLENKSYKLLSNADKTWPTWAFHKFSVSRNSKLLKNNQDYQKCVAPIGLWMKGDIDLDSVSKSSISIVGTRIPTDYGVEITKNFSTKLSRNHTIVSGGASGIDSIAHWGAINKQNKTICTIASGILNPTPGSNYELFEKIHNSGAIISEYPPEIHPAKHRYLIRNRLIAALSPVVIIIEAANRSGAINTAWWSRVLSANLGAVPGNIDSLMSKGTNALIKNNLAHICCDLDDVSELINFNSLELF